MKMDNLEIKWNFRNALLAFLTKRTQITCMQMSGKAHANSEQERKPLNGKKFTI